jgi:cytochrome bd-type quinol oxidase subunit 1
MHGNLVPALDPAPLPGPPWLFLLLWLVTFFIHLTFVNTVLGGTLLAALAALAGPGRREVQTVFVEMNSWVISLAITFGIAPLLFMQVLLGRFFYTATILVAWAWLGMLVILTVGYYLNYVAKFRLRAGKGAGGVLIVEAVCFLAIAAIQVTVNLLHMQPSRWEQVADSVWAALSDPTFVPRLLHFVLAAVAMAGALLAWVAVRRAAKGGEAATHQAMARFGVRAALVATLLQLVDGFWLLLALPEDVLRTFMRGGPVTMVPLGVGILAGVLLLLVLAQISDPLGQPTKVRRAAELIVGAMVFMVLSRQQVRDVYLASSRSGEQVVVAAQWGVLAVFLAVFVVCVGLTVYAVVRAVKNRPAPGEQAA